MVTNYRDEQCALLDQINEPFPGPWENGAHWRYTPQGFANGHARAFD